MNKKYKERVLVINTFHSRGSFDQEISWKTEEEFQKAINCDHVIGKDIKLIKEDDKGIRFYESNRTDFTENDLLCRHFLDYYIAIPESVVYDDSLYLCEYMMFTSQKHGILDTIDYNQIV